MLDKNNLIALAKQVARADRSAPISYSFNGENFSYAEMNEALRRELNEYVGTNADYRKNKEILFEVIESRYKLIHSLKIEIISKN